MEDRDVPPPPYSETDIYSNPGAVPHQPQPVQPAPLQAQPQAGLGISTSSVGSPHPGSTEAGSTTSTSGEVPIYTPPLTPQTTYHGNHSNFAAPVSDPASANTPTTGPDTAATEAAQHYFQSRPPPANVAYSVSQGSRIENSLHITPNSQPSDFPYPGAEFSSRDVGIQDWLTFRNFLFPAHSALATGRVLDRKLREEEESVKRHVEGSTSGNRGGSNGNNLNPSSTSTPAGGTGRTVTSPTLEQVRQQAQEAVSNSDQRSASRAHQEATIAEWNWGFFLPRGIVMKLATRTSPMPGAFEPAYDPLSQASVEPAATSSAQQGNEAEQAQRQNSFQRYNPFARPGGGIRVGGITIDNNGIRLGSSLVADNSGVRMGRLNIDNNGIRFGDNTLVPGRPGGHGHRHRHGHNTLARGQQGPPEGQRCSGGAFSSFPIPPMPPRPPMPLMPPGIPGIPALSRGNSDPGEETRGRSPNVGAEGSRTRNSSASSASSQSSLSSSNGSGSESSIGSLPSPSDLATPQLPVLQTRLQEWLALADHPSAPPLTRDNVEMLRADISNSASRNPNFREAAEAAALRRDIKVLVAEFKALKKRQKKEKKKERKEKKLRKKDEKKERRRERKEMRRERRAMRRGESTGDSAGVGAGDAGGWNGMAPPQPPVPPMPPNIFGRVPGHGGWGGGRGGGWGSWGSRGRGANPWGMDGSPNSTPGPWGNWTPGNWGEQWGRGRSRGGHEVRGRGRDRPEGRLSFGRGNSRPRNMTSPNNGGESSSSQPAPGLFSGLFPGAWPGENPADVPTQQVPYSEQQQRVFHRLSEAKYAAADRLDEQMQTKEAYLAVLHESIEGMERNLETGTVSLVSELEEHERAISLAEMEMAQVVAVKESQIADKQEQISALQKRCGGAQKEITATWNNKIGDSICGTSCDAAKSCVKGEKNKMKEEAKATKEKFKEEIYGIREEIQKLKEEASQAKQKGRERKSAAQREKRNIEDKMKSLRREGTDKAVQTKSQATILEVEIQGMAEHMQRLRMEGDAQYARELEAEG
ncbi:hypothetical protein MKZ38_008565 [Zalerion maritima]|uniref:Uncharacterized protein n=1 Tax=Zalerion maritima TaxID=339359 RepID=A0AAD5WTB6_9PEZI|nr:hypothetical protein MKZ38_008565 [Zalerion maritima]